nr:hypothetical protein [Tanacetum cinerariifolium]
MERLQFCDFHNMVAILKKGEFNTDFHPMVDFIAASPLRYALTIKPTVFVSHIRQFWSTARIETTDEGTHILATVDGIQRTVSEASLRRNLKLRDEDDIVSIPNTELFEKLTLMGYNNSQNQKFTFQKGQFSHQWKYLIHTIMQCLSPKSTGFNEFSSNIATALGEHNIDFHPMVDFVEASPLRIETTKEGTKILATVDGILRTVTESSLRRNLKLQDEEGINEPASPVRDVSQGEACPTISGFITDQDRTTIAKSSTLPHDSATRVTSTAAVEGSMQQTINELTDFYTSLQRQHSELLARFQAQEVEINKLKEKVKLLEDGKGMAAEGSGDDAPIKGRRLNEEEVATERVSSDIEEIRLDEGEVAAEKVVPTAAAVAPANKALDALCNKFHIPEEVHPVLPNQNDTMHERPAGRIGLYTRRRYAMEVRDFKKFFKRRGRFVRQPRNNKKTSQRSRDDKNGKSDRKYFRCGDPNHLIGECPKPPKDKNQRAFVGGSWSDSGEEDDEKVKNETCLVARASSKIITKNKRLKDTRNSLEKELRELKDKLSTLEKNKGVDLKSIKCQSLKIKNEKLKEEALNLTKFKKSTHCLIKMLSNQKPSGNKLGLGFNSFEASSSGTKEIKFVKAQKKVSSDGGPIKMGGPQSVQAAPKAIIGPPPVGTPGYEKKPDEWIKDSGCSNHITSNRNLFSTYKAYSGGNVIFGSNLRGNIIGKGKICDNKCRVTFSEHDSEITKDGKVIANGTSWDCQVGFGWVDNRTRLDCLVAAGKSMVWVRV